MTAPAVHNLSRANIRRLLTAVGSARAAESTTPPAAEYDWRDPHYFNEDQQNRLAAVMNQAAALMAEKFTHFYNREFIVAAAAITQHFAGDVHDLPGADQGYCLTFGPERDNPCGFVAVDAATALKWVTCLLGDAEPDSDPDRSLSTLEEALLYDLTTAVLEPVLMPLRPHHDLHPGAQITKGNVTIPFERTEAICKIAFQIRKTDSDEADEAFFLLSGSTLAPLVGKRPPAKPPASREERSPLVTEHVQRMPITITAKLASTILSVEELLDLGPDDILLFDKSIDEPLELVIDERVVFRGRPAQSHGQYAVLITQSAAESAPETSTSAAAN
jgi:flagellar motor switch protein FliM